MDADAIYKGLGEFVVSFQSLEDLFRQTGWLILDPHRKEWPPRSFRTDSFATLVNEVEGLYVKLMDNLAVKDADERKRVFRDIARESHQLREYRNRLVHSAYIELKAGGEVVGLLRSNPRLKEDPVSEELLWDQEYISTDSFKSGMRKLADVVCELGMCYTQLIHWAPFEKRRYSSRNGSRSDGEA